MVSPLSGNQRYVELYELTKAYPNPYGLPVKVVEGFNLIIARGEVVSLVGHSGCGKSTVLNMLAGLNSISSGGIVLDSREIDGPGPDRGLVFQSPCLLPWLSVLGNVLLGVDRVYPHATRAQRREVCEYYLQRVGLGDSLHKYPKELSAGMQQRVGIARAIALRPKMLLLDEPFGRLDSLTRMELQEVILEIMDQQQLTTLLITHDVDEALYMSDRICMMTNGPNARVGQVLELPLARPRARDEVLEHPDYYHFRGCLLSFLEEQGHARQQPQSGSAREDPARPRDNHAATKHNIPA